MLHKRAPIIRAQAVIAQAVIWCVGFLLNDRGGDERKGFRFFGLPISKPNLASKIKTSKIKKGDLFAPTSQGAKAVLTFLSLTVALGRPALALPCPMRRSQSPAAAA
jgi:hypothetical protein